MLITELLLVTSLAVELIIYVFPPFWRLRKILTLVSISLLVCSLPGLVINSWNILVALLLLVSLFRIFNLLRIIKGRMHERYLFRATSQTACYLGVGQCLLIVTTNNYEIHWTNLNTLLLITVAQALAGLFIFVITLLNVSAAKNRPNKGFFSDNELPTLSVVIPARNETLDLEICLKSVLANDYPKLEVLVLDDCSSDRTPEIIRSFAHAGVRFIKGHEPDKRWLAKNHAYDRLTDEATGDVLLFCGVDVRFGPQTIRRLVNTMLDKKLKMISVLSKRANSYGLISVIDPMRYWWELALPRRWFGRPPVLSSTWLINKDALNQMGKFDSVSRSIFPEGYFAQQLAKTKSYQFIISDNQLELASDKSFNDQVETAIRMRYPQIHRRPELALLITVVNLGLLIGPFVVLSIGILQNNLILASFALLACFFGYCTNLIITRVSNQMPMWQAMLNFNDPFALVAEMVIGYISMFRYEFTDVEWKGRNICIPVMHVVPHLPEMPPKITSN